jgi:RNA polymerase sigma-70 factor (ECF subfamily)
MQSLDEQKALARLKNGDIDALEVLVRLYQVPALDAAYLITRQRQTAEDIVQAAFVRVYERIHQFDSSRPFRPWFLRIVVNSSLTAMKHSNRNVSLEPEGDEETKLPSLESSVEESFAAVETREQVLEVLNALSPTQRAAIVMKYYLDLSDAEVAERLEVPASTVRRRLHYAREKLRRLLPNSI